MPIIVSNSSPIIALALINRIELLQRVYQQVLIPPAVYEEVAGASNDVPGATTIRRGAWLEIRPLAHTPLPLNLDPGETEAIHLAAELQADLLLMDERRGRRVAQRMGIPVSGTLATLVTAKQLGYINLVRPLLDELGQNGFRYSRVLLDHTLSIAGET